MIEFELVKRVDTPPLSIFYSMIHYKNEIFGFGRNHYWDERLINNIKLNENFDIIENIKKFKGEDPRCFIHKEKLYVLDNFLNDMYLIRYDDMEFIKINISGKNLSYISHNDKLYFIHYMKPFILYEHDLDTNTITHVPTFLGLEANHEYRGGTPGYRLGTNKYYGFGHRTYWKDSILLHDVFLWIVSFENEFPEITIHDVIQPPNSEIICDPTCVIEINNKYYMVTAESHGIWWYEQDYITNVYEIKNLENYMREAK